MTFDRGLLIVNADDLGMSRRATDAIIDSFRQSRVTSATAMTYMEDSERAADIALSEQLPVGLHLNFSTPFSAKGVPSAVRERQARIVRLFAPRAWLVRWVYIPGIQDLVDACVNDQLLAFVELFGQEPTHCDGHHFLHLSPNVLVADSFRAVPKVRKSLNFQHGEKSPVNRAIREMQNTFIERRHLTVDRVRLLSSVASQLAEPMPMPIPMTERVEIVVHPEAPDEKAVLCSDGWLPALAVSRLGSYADVD